MTESHASETNGETVANLERVREILFGEQARIFSTRVDHLEARLAEQLNSVRAELQERMEKLGGELRRELSDLSERLRTEQRARGDAVESLANEVHAQSRRIEERVGEFEERTSTTHRDARRELEESIGVLRDETRGLIDQTARNFDGRASDFERRKVERGELALFLTDIASRLSSAPPPPEADGSSASNE